MKELEKTYNPTAIEDRLHEKWLKGKYFHAEVNRSKRPLTIAMPPSNITGQLHMEHALDNTMQDILVRYKRMQGYEVLWQPGTDHAAIATEVRVIDELKKEGIDKKDLGRDGLLEEYWKWEDEYGTRTVNQLHKPGSSADWDRERFIMNKGCSDVVLEIFVKLYGKGYTYKGPRTINWCPVCRTSISDAEVEHAGQDGFFWHINYPVAGEPGRFVETAITRPETMLGDTAMAVNPEDECYSDIVDKMLKLPLTDRETPVIADACMDKEFGTGYVEITPAYDLNGFEAGKRHNLEEIVILNDDAIVNVDGPYKGMDHYEVRKAIVVGLEKQGLSVKVVPHSHSIGTHDRCKTTIEPMVEQQWFVKMEEMVKPVIEALKNGSLKFVPESLGKTHLRWLERIHDWCVSRQLWRGYRISTYYCQECSRTVVARGAPHTCPDCGCTAPKQDEGTLDTWFSPALWPSSTPGRPEKTEDLDYFYPTDALATGYDIIFFWVICMVLSGIEQTGRNPLHTILIHGLVGDSQSRKMSRSLGNGIDPLEVIDKYGTDALRITLITGNAPGSDMRFYRERVENSRNFANKVWDASRFIMMNIGRVLDISGADADNLTTTDRWTLSKANTLTKDVTENLDKYELGIALQKVYDFIWEEFCDWYTEIVKSRLYNKEDGTKAAAIWTLRTVLIQALELLRPPTLLVSEEIFCNLQEEEETIMVSRWPAYRRDWDFREEEGSAETIKEAVWAIRGVRTSMNAPPSKRATMYVVSEDEGLLSVFEYSRSFFVTLGYAGEVILQRDKVGITEDAVSAVLLKAVIYMPFAELADIKGEVERPRAEERRLAGEPARPNGMLSNEKLVSHALEARIAKEKAELEKYTQMMEQIKTRLVQFQKQEKYRTERKNKA